MTPPTHPHFPHFSQITFYGHLFHSTLGFRGNLSRGNFTFVWLRYTERCHDFAQKHDE